MSERIYIDESQRSAEPRNKEHPENESRVANAVDDECLVRRVACRLALEIETNQQIRAQPHALPPNKHQHVVIGEDQGEHREHEEIQVPEKAVVPALMRHVSGRINMNQHPDAGNKQQPDARQRIEQEPCVSLQRRRGAVRLLEVEVPGVTAEPGIENFFVRLMIVRRSPIDVLQHGAASHQKRKHDRPDANRAHRPLLKPAPEKKHNRRADGREQRNQPDVV